MLVVHPTSDLHCSVPLIADLHGLLESPAPVVSLIVGAVLRELCGIFSGRGRVVITTVLRLIDLFGASFPNDSTARKIDAARLAVTSQSLFPK